jgi:hypothetical protein
MKLVMVRAYTCGLTIDIHLEFWWRDMVIELYMILSVGWMLGWIQLFGNWCWKPAHNDFLVEIQSKLSEIRFGVADKPIWTISRSGSYSSSDTWDFLHKKKNVVEWWSLVWFPYAIPKQAFLLWLTLHNRLTTGDRLLSWGFNGDTRCVFCRNCTESRDHLFFLCSFSARIWKECMKRCNVPIGTLQVLVLIGRI